MNRPRLFLSAVSEELKTARHEVARTVRTLGFDPVSQDDFPTGHGELRQWLREQLDSCEGLIQLVGDGYGAEPPEVDPDYGRVSYTQFELLYAYKQKQKTWIIVIGRDFPRDKPSDQLDLPLDSGQPDPSAYQTERRMLQQNYLTQLKQQNHLRHTANNPIELDNIVLRLRDELGGWRQRLEGWKEWLQNDASSTNRSEAGLDKAMEGEPINLFYSYAHEDEELRDELAGHLKIMERRGVIRPWHDRCLAPGQKWDGKIHEGLQSADLVLLLISKDFINSDYIWGQELDIAMKRHASGEAMVVPVLLRAVDIKDAPFEALQGLPTDLRAVTSWSNRDEAWTDVAKGIRRTVEQIRAKHPRPSLSLQATPPVMSTPGSPSQASSGVRWKGIRAKASIGKLSESANQQAKGFDNILRHALDEFSDQLVEAGKARGIGTVDQAQTEQYARQLIDVPEQKRILWVDDQPGNNRMEAAALTKLQIEVVPVIGTKEALARIESDAESFDLVLSDWSRPELHLDTLSAGLHLLRQLRKRRIAIPVIFYHSTPNEQERSARHEQALHEGAFGEAVLPDELLGLVTKALVVG